MTQAVVAGALAVAACNAIAGLLGAWLWHRPSRVPSAGSTRPPRQPEHPQGARARSERSFWILLRVAQGSAIALAIAIGSLAAVGRYSSEHLFYLYALLPLAVAFIAEQLRVTAAQTILDQHGLADARAVGTLAEAEQLAVVAAIVRREVGVMAISALVVIFLALRAASTAHGF
jgi:hypothetical protein